ncbi:unnamed protein product [Prorocentrum cordatum]|uniref:Uncharacterized protein n=1 Tax=Prorocentrum cordatum TaxID=2364126 RepID=A0ABN9VF76_9DINO|nr:unnamed protein product [Polarella glacialis]
MLLDGPRRQKNAHVRAMPCRATPHAQPTGPSRPTTGPALRARQEATTRSDSRCARASELPSKARLDAHGAQAPLGGGQEEEEEEEEEEPVGEAGSWQWRCEGPASNAILSGRSSSGAIGLAAASIQQAGRQTRRGGSKKLRSTREAGRSSERCASPDRGRPWMSEWHRLCTSLLSSSAAAPRFSVTGASNSARVASRRRARRRRPAQQCLQEPQKPLSVTAALIMPMVLGE